MQKWFVASAVALAMVASTPSRADENLNFYSLYVGQGDMTVVECPGSKNFIIVDAGSSQDSKAAKVNLKEALSNIIPKGANVEFVLTHDHSDHSNLKSYVESIVLERDATWVEKGPITQTAEAYKDQPLTVDACNNKDVAVAVVYAQSTAKRGNDESTVLHFAFGGRAALLMGDAEAPVEEAFAGKWGQVTLLKVAHHGSASSSTLSFLQEIQPALAFVSAGRHKGYGHPRCTTLTNLAAEVTTNLDKAYDLFCYTDLKAGATINTSKAILVTRPFDNTDTFNFKSWFVSDGQFGYIPYNGIPAGDDPGDDDNNEDDEI